MGQGPRDDGRAPKRRPQPRQYRIYFLDAAEGEHSVIPFEARTDAEAYAAAKDHAGARPFELWNKDRLVIRRVASDAS